MDVAVDLVHVLDGAVDMSATIVIHVDDATVNDKGGAHVHGAVEDQVYAHDKARRAITDMA